LQNFNKFLLFAALLLVTLSGSLASKDMSAGGAAAASPEDAAASSIPLPPRNCVARIEVAGQMDQDRKLYDMLLVSRLVFKAMLPNPVLLEL
jgi:hypothetical protein